MRRLFSILLILSVPGMARAADLEQQLELARSAEDTHATIELLRRWLDGHPNDQAAVEELVALWLRVSDYGMALQTLKQTSSPEPGLVARTNAEVAWRRDDNLQEALKILRERAAAVPKDRATRLQLSQYLAKAGECREQIAVLDSLINEESSVDLLLDRADAKKAADDPAGALADFRQAAADGPDESRVQGARAGYERLESALAAVAVLDKKTPADPLAHFNKSYFWLYGGLPGRALVEAVEGLRGWPDSVYGKILEARALVETNKLTAAAALEERRVNTSAPLEDEKGRKGILDADAALASKPGDPDSLVNRASWLNYSGQYLLAMDDIGTVLKSDPGHISALHYAAAISLRQGNTSASTAYAEKLKALKASREILCDVYGGLAQIAFEQSNLQLALNFADQSIAAKSLPQTWKLKSACFTRLGQPNEAADALKKAEKGAR